MGIGNRRERTDPKRNSRGLRQRNQPRTKDSLVKGSRLILLEGSDKLVSGRVAFVHSVISSFRLALPHASFYCTTVYPKSPESDLSGRSETPGSG